MDHRRIAAGVLSGFFTRNPTYTTGTRASLVVLCVARHGRQPSGAEVTQCRHLGVAVILLTERELSGAAALVFRRRNRDETACHPFPQSIASTCCAAARVSSRPLLFWHERRTRTLTPILRYPIRYLEHTKTTTVTRPQRAVECGPACACPYRSCMSSCHMLVRCCSARGGHQPNAADVLIIFVLCRARRLRPRL